MNSSDSIESQLAALRLEFIAQLPHRISTLDEVFGDWQGGDNVLADFHRLAHSLTGAGATFGCDGLSQSARRLELFLKDLVDKLDPGPVSDLDINTVTDLLADVRAEVDRMVGAAKMDDQLSVIIGGVEPAEVENERLVYLLENEAFAQQGDIKKQLEHFDYQVERFATTADLFEAVEKQRPALILSEIDLPEGGKAGLDVVVKIQKRFDTPIPTIFIASDSDFEMRLAAVRAWGMAYFSRPLSIDLIVEVMDNLLETTDHEPFKILIVDDEPELANHYALVLRQKGMEVRVATESMSVFDVMKDFVPELILMDMYMPRCNGVELAAVIRQKADYVGVPIIFLSAERDRSAQLDAMRNGGDDFLTKPILPDELKSVVTIRAERYRVLRSYMSRDSLTGLLNHAHIMESLNHELARVERYGAPLSFVMVDLDNFKSINDSYGHAAGDAVLKSLSHLLQQRLRKTDIIGRYGGEEFAIIMPDTPLVGAATVMDEIREHFAQVAHRVGDDEFFVTLSAGVAAVPPINDAGILCDVADKLLCLAKNGGRNHVISACESE